MLGDKRKGLFAMTFYDNGRYHRNEKLKAQQKISSISKGSFIPGGSLESLMQRLPVGTIQEEKYENGGDFMH